MIYHKSYTSQVLPFFVTIPHSGEQVPPEAYWLRGLSETHLMRDVDRYVDALYLETLNQLNIPYIATHCHRYVIDQNRLPTDYDTQSVQEAPHPRGTHTKGLHWCQTTLGEPLITQPMSVQEHQILVDKYYTPFHRQIRSQFEALSGKTIYHLDAHSMPSRGTPAHNDPGEDRADIVVSDFHGKSCSREFSDIVIQAYKDQGFSVAYNWPYFGGGITQMYGRPEQGHHTLQVELNRKTYMTESTKQKNELFESTKQKIHRALEQVYRQLSESFS